ncbi:magnesium-translocating P-type ATPase [Tatumella sp. UBA2305]|uniref:magnesium-translocating P-type ATPase n=1 Tax=Tatumella sp. UBA2305 TaxID=1947647 RepID=UPI0025D260F3|nr:magnesium-translocating P-type ATPase [Tatumella sp. UBA2305]
MTQIINSSLPLQGKKQPQQQNDWLITRHIATSTETTLQLLNASIGGLTSQQVTERQATFGPNEIATKKAPSALLQWILAFNNPFIYVLMALAAVSFITDYWIPRRSGDTPDLTGVIIMSCMILFSTLLRFIQEFRTNKAADALNSLVEVTTTVRRRNAQNQPLETRIPRHQLVPGDIVLLSAGDIISADMRLLESSSLQLNQSALTGETLPVEKHARLTEEEKLSAVSEHALLHQPAIVLMSTSVLSGSATAVVVATGKQSWFGSLAGNIAGEAPKSSFDKGVNSVSWLLIRFMVLMVPVVFLINGFTKGEWTEALFFSLAVAVGLTPEMLPMIVSTNLAKGAMALAAHQVVVKKINAIQNLGAMTVLCTDKTGTLTDDNIVLEQALNLQGEEDPRVAEMAWLNSHFQQGIDNPMDRAINRFANAHGMARRLMHVRKADELPFDFTRRCLSVSVYDDHGRQQLICKGASEEMLARCQRVLTGDRETEITPELNRQLRDKIAGYNREGYRVLLLGRKTLETTESLRRLNYNDEQNLTLCGVLLFLDPVKRGADIALRALKEHGVLVKVLTGDNAEVTEKICGELGLEGGHPLQGPEIAEMDDDTLQQKLASHTIFSRLTPSDKTRIVTLLQAGGETVGFLGDGINDAAALHAADVGISVDNATQIAQNAADIILLEKDLQVLEKGVRIGRQTFGNIIKYLNITASSNFGNVFSVLIASAFIPFMPMLAIQLLLQNLIYDVSQMVLPWDAMDEEFVAKPRQWDAGNIGRFMLFFGPVSSVFDVATFALMWHVFAAHSSESQSLFQSGWFVEGLLSQTLVVHMLRTRKVPFLQSCARWPVLLSTLVVVVIGIALPYSPLAVNFHLQALPLSYFPWLLLILAGYCLLSQTMKQLYSRRFGQWF